MQLFYNGLLNVDSYSYTLSKDESKHVIRVLRKTEGDTIYVTNGQGYLFTTSIIIANPNKCKLAIRSYIYQKPREYKLHLAVAPTKLNDRFEWFLEKATEIGVTQITPILCDHSERKVIKEDRFNKIIQSAMKQSLHYHLPVLNPLTPLRNFIDSVDTNSCYIAHCEEGQKNSLKDTITKKNTYTILIGPEGDFSSIEIEKALAMGIKAVTLGTSRLRTETAAIVACHSVAFINE